MTKQWFQSMLWTLLLVAALDAQSRESVLKAIQQSSRWSPADAPASFNDKNISEIAGKYSDTIKRYGVIGATAQTWSGSDGSVRLVLYEMADPSAAYGLFTIDRNVDQPGFASIPIGIDGFRVGNHAEFWQSKYVVKLEGSAAATDHMGRFISENIFGR